MQYNFYVRTFAGSLPRTCLSLREYSKQTCHSSQKGNAFHQCRSQDHVSTNVVRSLGLAGNGFYGTFTDLSDTDTGTHSGKARANCTITRLYSV
jgi:hypothetical protein